MSDDILTVTDQRMVVNPSPFSTNPGQSITSSRITFLTIIPTKFTARHSFLLQSQQSLILVSMIAHPSECRIPVLPIKQNSESEQFWTGNVRLYFCFLILRFFEGCDFYFCVILKQISIDCEYPKNVLCFSSSSLISSDILNIILTTEKISFCGREEMQRSFEFVFLSNKKDSRDCCVFSSDFFEMTQSTFSDCHKSPFCYLNFLKVVPIFFAAEVIGSETNLLLKEKESEEKATFFVSECDSFVKELCEFRQF
jgi:hypothetical protein